MYAAEVERYLEALNEELVIQGIVTPVPVLLLGGIFIMMEVNSRCATDDVDVLPFIGAEKIQRPTFHSPLRSIWLPKQ